MSSFDGQAARVAGLLTVPSGRGPVVPRRFGTADAWLVPCGGERRVLKLGRPEQTEADVTWEHEYLLRLAGTGFPASVPVPAFDGRSWVQVDGRIWSVLSFLPGQPMASQPAPDMAAAGTFLARYHQVARTLPVRDQRPTEPGLSPLRAVTPLDRLGTGPGDADSLRRYLALLDDLEDGLHALEYDSLEHLVIHGDATNDNLIVDGAPPRIVGLIDFGAAHLAPWPADLAAALWRSGRPDPEGIAYDPGRIRHYVRGYHRESLLPAALAQAIPLLMQGRGLQLISRRLRRARQGQTSPAAPYLHQTLDRAAWLHTHRAEVIEAIAGVLSSGPDERDGDG